MKLDFPKQLYLFTEDTSKFQEARDLLVEMGLIPKPICDMARPLDERIKESLPWQVEGCCVLPVPGRENLAETNYNGWGIYRVVFKDRADDPPGFHPTPFHIDFRYCLKVSDESHDELVGPNPMKPHIVKIHDLIQPVVVWNDSAVKIDFPYSQ